MYISKLLYSDILANKISLKKGHFSGLRENKETTEVVKGTDEDKDKDFI